VAAVKSQRSTYEDLVKVDFCDLAERERGFWRECSCGVMFR